MPTKTRDELLREHERNEAAGFDSWMALDSTKFMVSIIPGSSEMHKDALRILLKSAFSAGYSCGGATAAAEFLEAIMRGSQR